MSLLDNDNCADPAKIAGSIFDFSSRTYAIVLIVEDARVDHQRTRIAHAIIRCPRACPYAY
mgnify:FL=1